MNRAVLGTLLLVPAVASAEGRQLYLNAAGEASTLDFVGEAREDGLVMARQVVPAPDSPIVGGVSTGPNLAVAQSRIIYLNRGGVTLSPGNNDARTNRSTIVTQTTTFAAWNISATDWQAVVSCTRDLFSRFDATVVDTDPGNVPHIEAVFGGSPTQVGMPSNVAGVSPFTTDCSIIENSIVFTFTGAFQFTPRQACEIMAQEIAHSYGLDHELLASDPMTYLNYNGNRAFQDQTAQCGESTARNCGINGSVCRTGQNSVALLKERLGTGGDLVAPTMNWASPSDGSTVPPGFEVKASGTDNIAVTGAVLKIDGMQTDMKTGAGPFTFVTSSTLAEGQHTVVVEVSDGKNIKSETRTVTVMKGAPPPDGTGSGSGSGGGVSGDPDLNNGDIVGGCTASRSHAGWLFALGVLLVALRRRRR